MQAYNEPTAEEIEATNVAAACRRQAEAESDMRDGDRVEAVRSRAGLEQIGDAYGAGDGGPAAC